MRIEIVRKTWMCPVEWYYEGTCCYRMHTGRMHAVRYILIELGEEL